jgi:hypothetical protein
MLGKANTDVPGVLIVGGIRYKALFAIALMASSLVSCTDRAGMFDPGRSGLSLRSVRTARPK